MAVIINEFEIISSQPAPPGAEQINPETPTDMPQTALSPRDIADILCHEADRAARLRAH